MVEGLLLKKEDLNVEGMETEHCRNRVKAALSQLQGIAVINVESGRVSVGYYPQLISADLIKREIEKLGYAIKRREKARGAFMRFLDRLAESNQKTFGSEPPDCCKLNKK